MASRCSWPDCTRWRAAGRHGYCVSHHDHGALADVVIERYRNDTPPTPPWATEEAASHLRSVVALREDAITRADINTARSTT